MTLTKDVVLSCHQRALERFDRHFKATVHILPSSGLVHSLLHEQENRSETTNKKLGRPRLLGLLGLLGLVGLVGLLDGK